ncbi:MipA/OmpV family protein [Pasteurella oralis]|uniref:MipA/OmpV family protein n=1 Tax=Pasteurella oralis TaxID=1071947 RepID=UPI00142DB4A9|nr:MipA/OmpV family protein [Pasteurella oralis]
MSKYKFLLLSLASLTSSIGLAEDNTPNISLNIGAGIGVSNNIYHTKNTVKITPIPILEFNWGNFYISSINEVGYETNLNDNLSISVFSNFFDGFPIKSKELLLPYNSIKNRKSQITVGSGINYDLDHLGLDNTSLSLQARSGKRGISAETAINTIYPITQKLFISSNISVHYYSAKYTDYYFGIKKEELGGAIMSVYKPKSSYDIGISINTIYTLTENLNLNLSIDWTKYSKAIKQSPIVKRDSQLSSSFSLSYSF